jgi:hypothetical protein
MTPSFFVPRSPATAKLQPQIINRITEHRRKVIHTPDDRDVTTFSDSVRMVFEVATARDADEYLNI